MGVSAVGSASGAARAATGATRAATGAARGAPPARFPAVVPELGVPVRRAGPLVLGAVSLSSPRVRVLAAGAASVAGARVAIRPSSTVAGTSAGPTARSARGTLGGRGIDALTCTRQDGKTCGGSLV